MTAAAPTIPDTVSRERYNREKQARLEAEQMLEQRSRELYEANLSLAAALEKEKQLVSLQYALITSINHEMRTPLTIIDGTAGRIEKISEGPYQDRILTKCGQIRQSVQNLIRVVETSLQAIGDRRDEVVMPIDVQPLTRQPMSDR